MRLNLRSNLTNLEFKVFGGKFKILISTQVGSRRATDLKRNGNMFTLFTQNQPSTVIPSKVIKSSNFTRCTQHIVLPICARRPGGAERRRRAQRGVFLAKRQKREGLRNRVGEGFALLAILQTARPYYGVASAVTCARLLTLFPKKKFKKSSQ